MGKSLGPQIQYFDEKTMHYLYIYTPQWEAGERGAERGWAGGAEQDAVGGERRAGAAQSAAAGDHRARGRGLHAHTQRLALPAGHAKTKSVLL